MMHLVARCLQFLDSLLFPMHDVNVVASMDQTVETNLMMLGFPPQHMGGSRTATSAPATDAISDPAAHAGPDLGGPTMGSGCGPVGLGFGAGMGMGMGRGPMGN